MEFKDKLRELVEYLRTLEEVEDIHLSNKHIVKADDENWGISEINEEIDVSFTFKSRG